MVYESDFYTTRRPYHRPTVTSYSVTAHTYHPSIPFIAHRKLNNVTTPVPHNQVRKSVIGNTLDRIQHRVRPLQSYDPMEDFLNERSVTSFEDVTRSIRANTAALLKQVNTPIPRAVKPLSVSNLYNHTETAIPDRISSDEYIWHLLRPLPGKPSNGIDVGYYPETSTRIPLGKTHLACLSYAGAHPISKRRQLVAGAGDEYRNVRNDVELLSHYNRMRQAANLPHVNGGVRNETSNDGGSRFKYNATTTPHTTNEVIANGTSSTSDDDKENIAANYQKPLKKKPSKEPSVDEDRLRIEQENALKAKKAEEERLEQERQERLAEQERLEEERKAEEERLEQERKAEEERLEQERLEEERLEQERLEEERLEQERKAEEERLEQERLAEEERLEQERIAEEEEQRLLEEKLVEEYHREQEKLAEEQRIRELEYAEEQQRQAQEKLVEEQQLLHDKLMEIKQKQEAEEEDVEDVEKEEEAEQSTAAEDEVEEKAEENNSEYVTCNNIPKDEAENKNESAESEVSDEEEPAIAEKVQQNGSIEIEEIVQVKYSVKSSVEHEYNVKKTEEDDEKSENTDANSEISETEELNNSTVPELNHAESKENDEVQNDSKENEEESEEEEEEEDEEEEEEE